MTFAAAVLPPLDVFHMLPATATPFCQNIAFSPMLMLAFDSY
jgi:hypothetical protein